MSDQEKDWRLVTDVVSLRDHFESRIEALEKATEVAEKLMDKRLEGMNHLQAQLREQAAVSVSNREFQIVVSRLESDVRMLRESKAMLEGKASQSSVSAAMAISVLGLILALLGLLRTIM